MRLIDADALRKQISETYEYEFPTAGGGFDEFATKIIPNIINNAITADAVPVVRGEWIVDECDTSDDVPSYSWIDFHCSECNANYGLEEGQYDWCRYEKIPYNYCPNCGADMRGRDGKE